MFGHFCSAVIGLLARLPFQVHQYGEIYMSSAPVDIAASEAFTIMMLADLRLLTAAEIVQVGGGHGGDPTGLGKSW